MAAKKLQRRRRQPHAVEVLLAPFDHQIATVRDHHLPGTQRLARPHVQQRPCRATDRPWPGLERPLEQHVDRATARFAARQARRHHPSVVEHQQVARLEQPGKRAAGQVPPRVARRTDRQQSRGAALGEGLLGDEFGRQWIVEVGGEHGLKYTFQIVLPAPGWRNW